MAGWPPRVRHELNRRQHKRAAVVERAEFVGHGIFLHARGRTAGQVRDSSFDQHARLAIDQHECGAGEWVDADWGFRNVAAAILSRGEGAVNVRRSAFTRSVAEAA